jgi:hypothetical protein
MLNKNHLTKEVVDEALKYFFFFSFLITNNDSFFSHFSFEIDKEEVELKTTTS